MAKVKTISINGTDLDIATDWENVDNKPESATSTDLAKVSKSSKVVTIGEDFTTYINLKTVDGKTSDMVYNVDTIDWKLNTIKAMIPTFEFDEDTSTLKITAKTDPTVSLVDS